MTTSILYLEVTAAAVETASKIIAQRKAVRGGAPLRVTVGAKGGQTASVSVNGSTVTMNLPTMPASTMLSRSEADRMLGFVAHECLHVLHTDWHWWQVCVQAGSRVRHWANCLEDVRIEAKELRAGHFPALRGILSATMDHMHYQGLASATKAGRVIGARLADAPYCLAVLGRMANKYTVPTARNLRRNLHPDVARLVDLALIEVRTCKTTQDVYRLALRLERMERQMIQDATPRQRRNLTRTMARLGRPLATMATMARLGRPLATMATMARLGRPLATMARLGRLGRPLATMARMASLRATRATRATRASLRATRASLRATRARLGRPLATMARLGRLGRPLATMARLGRLGRPRRKHRP